MARSRRTRAAGRNKPGDDPAANARGVEEIAEEENEVTDPEEGPSRIAKKKPKPRKRKRGKFARDSSDGSSGGEDVLIMENGQRIPIPPKHNSPIQHSRPKRSRAEEPTMRINVNARNASNLDSAEDLPSAPIYISDSCSVSDLQDAIHASCPFLPPKAQKLFCKDGQGSLVMLDPEGLLSLKDLGFALPGPHEVWLQCNLQDLYPEASQAPASQAAATGLQAMPTTVLPQASPLSAQSSPTLQDTNAAEVAEPVKGEAYLPIIAMPSVRASSPETGEATGQQPAGDPSASTPPTHFRENTGGNRNRKNKRWSDQEVENLLQGVMWGGLSNWTEIAQRWEFPDRTTVDLKDKWRNLVKNVRDGRQMRGMVLTEEAKSRIWRIMREKGVPLQPQTKPQVPVIQTDPVEED